MNTIKVCHIASGDLWAGAEAVVFQMLKGLRNHDVDLSVILLNEGRLAEEILALGIPLSVVDEKTNDFPRIFTAIAREISRSQPRIIHSHRYKENMLAYLAAKMRRDAALIATQHGMQEIQKGVNNFKQRVLNMTNSLLMKRCFHKVVAVSNDIRKTLVDNLQFRPDKVAVIRNGVEAKKAGTGKIRNNHIVIGSSGRLAPVKDFPLMVHIASKVCKSTDKIQFQLAGDGPELDKIRSLVRRQGLERAFILRGFEQNMSSFYEGLDVYMSTSVHEGISMSVLEAMSHGLPVIAPRVGGFAEIIDHGVQGYLIKGRNPNDFADKCFALIADAAMRKRMGLAACARVQQQFSLERMAHQYFDLYRGVGVRPNEVS